jgi:hypothetical protein
LFTIRIAPACSIVSGVTGRNVARVAELSERVPI